MSASLCTRFGGHRSADGNVALDNAAIMRIAPSVFAESAHESRSARYVYIPTIELLDGLRREGFECVFAVQSRTRSEGNYGYTKHMLRLRHRDQMLTKTGAHEILFINSHNGSSASQLLGGEFRSVCTNSLVCGDVISDIRIKHSGNAQHDVVQGAFHLLGQFSKLDECVDGFQTRILTAGEQQAYARAAIVARFDVETPDDAPITADQALTPRRFEDRKPDLWTTFNRVQENLVGGGLRTRKPDGNGKVKRNTTRPIQGIDQNTALNRALWTLAEALKAS